MNTENLSTLKIHKLTQEQYDRELAAGRIDPNALYLTPDKEVDMSIYATESYVNDAIVGIKDGMEAELNTKLEIVEHDAYSAITLPQSKNWYSVTYGNGKFVAVAYSPNAAAYSEDGINWTETTMPQNKQWYSVTYGNGKFVAIAYDSNIAAYSEDGINWTETEMPQNTGWQSVTYGNGKFVAIAWKTNIAAYSEDGINWTETTLPQSQVWNSVTYGNGKFVAVAWTTNIAAYSEDGINWTETTLPQSRDWNSVAYGNGKFVAVTYYSTIAAYSEDGINWIKTTISQSKSWQSVTYGNGKFVAIAYDSNIAAYSEDGINWVETTMPQNKQWQSVTYGNGKFVVVASNSNIAAYSEDGINWTDKYVSETYKTIVQNDIDVIEDIKNIINIDDKADVVHTHSYNDLTDKPNIPSIDGLANISDVSGHITIHDSSPSAHSDIRHAINGKANASHTHTANDLQGLGYLSNHPELNSTVIPFIYNDLAFLTSKGGSVRMYKTTSTDYTAIQLNEQSVGYDSLSKLFDGSPSYVDLSRLDNQTCVVIDMDLGRGYSWSNKFYIDFGNNNWAPENLKLYVRNPSYDETYVLKNEYSNGRKNNWACNLSHLDGKGFSQIRLVLNGFYAENGTVGRIAQIGLINYGSSGVKETFISRGGCEGIYGNLSPNKNSDINLGSGDKHWNTIYVDEIVGAIPTVTASDSGKFLRVSANGSWVAEAIPITATDDGNGNVTLFVGMI